ncbi:MAG: sialate O-acetylesterase [Bryobacteraceae bacterium]
MKSTVWMARAAVIFVLGVQLDAQTLHVTGGAVDDQVFQRNAAGRAEVVLTGTASGAGSGPLEARVIRKHMAVPGFDWAKAGEISGRQWSATVRDLPAGGPYRIEIRVPGTQASAAVNNVLVGDLWVLAGQSNMQGVGDLVDVQQPHDLVHNFGMADHWMVAEEPLHTLVNAADRVHWPMNAQKQPERLEGARLTEYVANRKKGAGLGLPFAVEMVRRTGIPIGLLSCAHGGTSMDQWNPALKDKAGDSLYGSMLRRVRAAGGKVKGVLWYQGESDANPRAASAFQRKFERLVTSIRDDFGQPDLPFYYVQIGRHVNDANVTEWNLVQDAQRKAEAAIPRSAMVASIDASLDDGIHVGTGDLKRLGRRMANLACRDLFPELERYGKVKRGPRPVSAAFNNGVVRVEFSDVNGGLRADGRIAGFSIHAGDGAPRPMIYKARVDPGDSSAVLLHVGGKLPEGATLHYGFGKDPYCNLRDQADMAAPVFGPMEIR